MLENYFKHPQTLRKFRCGLLGPQMDGLAEQLKAQGYSYHTSREMLRYAAHFGSYAMWSGISEASKITPQVVDSFLNEHLSKCWCERPNAGRFAGAAASIKYLLDYLYDQNILMRPDQPSPPYSSIAEVLARYQGYLLTLRGVSPKTCDVHLRTVKRFLDVRGGTIDEQALAHLTGKEVLDYVTAALAEPYGYDWKHSVVSCLRTFLRFLRWERIIEQDLSRCIPSVHRWRLADIPRHMPFEDVRRLIDAPDVSTQIGKRDRAAMMLLGFLGLRACEVIALTLDHINWREECLTAPPIKSKIERTLPMPPELSAALVDYLRHGRPKTEHRQIFMRHVAPIAPLASSGALLTIVRKYLIKAGIDSPSKGTHLLRHSLATRLVNTGVPMKEIADILGHSSLETTRIYAKVDTHALTSVALPFPSVEEA